MVEDLMVCSIFHNSNTKTHWRRKHCCSLFRTATVRRSGGIRLFTLFMLMWMWVTQLLPKKSAAGRAQHGSWLYDTVIIFILHICFDQAEWAQFQGCLFLVVASDLSDTRWLIVPLGSWRECTYSRWQWITRTGAQSTFSIAMVIDAFETRLAACSEIKSPIPEALQWRWRTEEMFKNAATWQQPPGRELQLKAPTRERTLLLSLFRVCWGH